MTWRWVWSRAQLTAVLVSAVVWLMLMALVPVFVVVFGLFAVAVVAGWSSWPVLWWRYGARRLRPVEAEAVWRALVPLEWLRGRNQPRLWVGSRVDAEVTAVDTRQLVLSERLLALVAEHRVSDHQVCRLVAQGFGLVEVNRSRLVATVDVFCAPWALLEIVAITLAGRVATAPLVRFAWRARWLFVVLAGIALYGRGHWPGLVMLTLVAVATVTTPRWNRAWAVRQTQLRDQHEHPNTGTAIARGSGRPSSRVPARPMSGRGGAR